MNNLFAFYAKIIYNLSCKLYWEIDMSISYKKLWKKLIDIEMTKTQLRIQADLGTATLAKLGKDQQVSMDVLLRICKVLNCNISDIMDVLPLGGRDE